MKHKLTAPLTIVGIAIVTYGLPAQADIVTLGFEEFGAIDGNEAVGDFYAGGTNEAGITGPDYGITFSENALALTSQTTNEPGADGNFENNPVGDNILFFLGGEAATMNVAGGFETGFSFYYTSSEQAFVNVYDEPDGQGNILQSLDLSQNWQDANCTDTASTDFCNFNPVGVEFDGVAQSVDFGGTINQVGYDAITLGTDVPGDPTEVPEPATLTLFATGLLGLMGLTFLRRRPVS
ncbi:putative secreted protein with PEP-CTERM sorting signal [Alkalispirillum mobile]|uniref:Putative secreted protein with PEP-CTERM sorting signal n=1 Tax=Alkalispirillum mobile TaxID=85925 RepID=A0A498C554_9GAMM|nr:PEP-CTERM sorting domain-containing protein [Alkalispirillum mobile]RLK50752.1 putative secreted protein with PEP-CTERM sorting signal [Alkalispirillum mobile]